MQENGQLDVKIDVIPNELAKKKKHGYLYEGVYLYKYMNSFKRFFDDKLPDWCKFSSSLKGKCVSDNGYLHAANLWNMLEMKTMGAYDKNRCFIVTWYLWKVYNCVHGILWARSLSLF